MRAYIVGYTKLLVKGTGVWSPEKISQEGYSTYEAARNYIMSRPSNPVKCSCWHFQTAANEEYYIHEVIIKEAEND